MVMASAQRWHDFPPRAKAGWTDRWIGAAAPALAAGADDGRDATKRGARQRVTLTLRLNGSAYSVGS
jgi:hypothetical protein